MLVDYGVWKGEIELPENSKTAYTPSGVDYSMVRAVRRHIGATGTFVDAGAHCGLISSAISGNVICIEPDVENLRHLKKNVPHAVIFEGAVCETDGFAFFGVSDENTTDHRLIHKNDLPNKYNEHTRKSIQVDTTRLDSLLRKTSFTRPLVIKLDIQGAEMQALRSLGDIKPDFIFMELWPYGLLRMGETLESVMTTLSRFKLGTVFSHETPLLFNNGHVLFTLTLPWESAKDGSFMDYFELVVT